MCEMTLATWVYLIHKPDYAPSHLTPTALHIGRSSVDKALYGRGVALGFDSSQGSGALHRAGSTAFTALLLQRTTRTEQPNSWGISVASDGALWRWPASAARFW